MSRQLLIKLGFEKEDATPLQWSRLLIAILALFASAFNITFLFPFLPEMVSHFGYAEDEKGYYVGLIASMFFFGRALGSSLWGYLSDKKGRRPFLMLCLMLTALSTVVFGLSKSVPMAMGIRFLTGFVNGSVGLVKTILYELSDDTNQGIAMSTISLAWGSGIVIGPLVGGYLSLPGEKYPAVFGAVFWKQFPFVVPCLMSAAVCLVAMVAVFFRLPETNDAVRKKAKKVESDSAHRPMNKSSSKDAMFVDVEGPDLVQSRSNLARMLSADDVSGKARPQRNAIYRPSMVYMKTSVSEPDVRVQNTDVLLRSHSHRSHLYVEDEVKEEEERRKSCWTGCCNNIFFKTMSSSNVRLVILLYSLTSFSIIGFEEVFILFASTDSRLGGLDFSTNDLGAATGFMSIPLLTLQLFIFPRLERRFGAKKTAIGSTATLMILMMLCPLTRLLVHQ